MNPSEFEAFERQHCLASADQLLGTPFTHSELAKFIERERLHARLEFQSSAYRAAWTDCIQDGLNNCPFQSIGGPNRRQDPRIPHRTYLDSPKSDEEMDRAKQEWVRGYLDCARYHYGEDWLTCQFGWAPALQIIR